ncbi:MAG TPA: Rv3654c family TadE-like protein [Angustibacter sp.]|nr:Rv3654c family TadE-like protein [Angustibacter sp.]
MTAELAVALPAVALTAAAVVAVAQAAVAQVDCVDAARAGARAAARGDSASRVQQVARRAAGGASTEVDVATAGGEVTVAVRRRVRLVLPQGPHVTVRARASAETETGRDGWAERGSATVLATALVALAASLAVLLAAWASVVVARHRAAGAADLAALAAASALVRSPTEACAAAQRSAARNGARVTGCQVGPTSVDVTVGVRPAGAAGRLGEAVSRARAGAGGAGTVPGRRQGWR